MKKNIDRDAEASAKIFDNRSLQKDYATLIPVLRKGMRILDVGCGTGAITKDIARAVGPAGSVLGIDNTMAFIEHGRKRYHDVSNMELLCEDMFTFRPDDKFDLVVAARVLQWIPNVRRSLEILRDFLKAGGILSVLDYNHEALEWNPEPPASMRKFYDAFLSWRAHAAMDNRLAENLAGYFSECGFHAVEIHNADEHYFCTDADFVERMNIWTKVAGLKQIVQERFIDEASRVKAINDYSEWLPSARSMTMCLKEVRGVIST